MSTREESPSLWHTAQLSEGVLYRMAIADLSIWLRRGQGQWFLAWLRGPDSASPAALQSVEEEPDGLAFSHWLLGEDAREVHITAAMPDRGLVVHPAAALNVPSGTEALFFFLIPIWIRVMAAAPQELILSELPAQILSNTWFGEPTSGELCYSVRSPVLMNPRDESVSPWTAICPVRIRNAAPLELAVHRLLVHAQNLELYLSAQTLWTNEISMRFLGQEHSSQITIGKGAPEMAPEPERICDARIPSDKTFLRQSFSFLRSLTSI